MLWNVQGASKPTFLTTPREIVRINTPMVLGLVETHISGEKAPKFCDHIGFSGQTRVEEQGFSGGIWLFWKQEEVSVDVIEAPGQHITVTISKHGDTPWLFSAIYASPDSTIRRELWRELEHIKRKFLAHGFWLVTLMKHQT